MNAWLTLSGSCVYRLYERGQGGYGYLTEQPRGGRERAISALIPMREARRRVDGFSFRCVDATPENLSRVGWDEQPGVPPDPLAYEEECQ